jgi:hypothetical protein
MVVGMADRDAATTQNQVDGERDIVVSREGDGRQSSGDTAQEQIAVIDRQHRDGLLHLLQLMVG